MRNILLKILAGIWILFPAIFVAMMVSAIIPDSGGAFELRGEFNKKPECSGGMYMPLGYQPLCEFGFVVSEAEFNRVEENYPWHIYRTGPGLIEGRVGYVRLGRVTTGMWCGQLPDEGHKVWIFSTGYTGTTYIWDYNSQKLYNSDC